SFGGPGMSGPGGGGAFMFNITPEGDDVITHEVATALRLEEQDRIRKHVALPIAPAPRAVVPVTRDTPSLKDDPNKVSLVGEKSAPLKSYEEENLLSPSERRQKVLRDYFRSHIDPVGRIVAE